MWFSKKKLKVRIIAFESKVQKYKYLIRQFENSSSKVSLWLYYFDTTRGEIQSLCQATQTAVHLTTPSELLREGINLLDARNIDLGQLHGYEDLLLVETHPIFSIHKQIVSQAEQHKLSEFICFTSLDAPIMQLFGGERLQSILSRMGLKEAEPIEHSMITKSLEKAQKKLEASLTQHQDIRSSPEEWVEKNPVQA